VPFKRRCNRQQRLLRQWAGDVLEYPQSRNRRRRAAAKTCGERNVTVDLGEHGRHRTFGLPGDRRKGTFDGVGSSHCRPAAYHFEPRTAVMPDVDDTRAQVELNRHAERVKPTAEIGGRAGTSTSLLIRDLRLAISDFTSLTTNH
jgi:hypothetical protein